MSGKSHRSFPGSCLAQEIISLTSTQVLLTADTVIEKSLDLTFAQAATVRLDDREQIVAACTSWRSLDRLLETERRNSKLRSYVNRDSIAYTAYQIGRLPTLWV